jgi:hypothetical protein
VTCTTATSTTTPAQPKGPSAHSSARPGAMASREAWW